MRAGIMVVLAFCATTALGEETAWTPLEGAQISQALAGKKLQYANAWQEFRVSGRTLYNAGRDSWGYWRVQSDMYCSQWPPSDLWACYGVERRGKSLRFVTPGAEATEGTYRD